MAIIGGAGNPVGGSFTGPSTAIEVVGDETGLHKFGYAYSGQVTDPGSAAADTTVFDFTTGNYIFVGSVTWVTNYQGANGTFIDISFNDGSIFVGTYDEDPHVVNDQPFDLVIPPYTKVVFKWGTTGVTRELCALLAGRVYR